MSEAGIGDFMDLTRLYPLDHMAGPERTTPLGAPGGPERRGQAACSLIPCSGTPAYPIDSDPHAGETSYRPDLLYNAA